MNLVIFATGIILGFLAGIVFAVGVFEGDFDEYVKRLIKCYVRKSKNERDNYIVSGMHWIMSFDEWVDFRTKKIFESL